MHSGEEETFAQRRSGAKEARCYAWILFYELNLAKREVRKERKDKEVSGIWRVLPLGLSHSG